MAINVQMNLLGDDGNYQALWPEIGKNYKQIQGNNSTAWRRTTYVVNSIPSDKYSTSLTEVSSPYVQVTSCYSYVNTAGLGVYSRISFDTYGKWELGKWYIIAGSSTSESGFIPGSSSINAFQFGWQVSERNGWGYTYFVDLCCIDILTNYGSFCPVLIIKPNITFTSSSIMYKNFTISGFILDTDL